MALVQSVFGRAIDTAKVRIRRRRWFPWQGRDMVMAPCGHIHFHPQASCYCDDFAAASLPLQGLFIHEMAHVWQSQQKGRWYLPLCRPFSRRYDYRIIPGWKFSDYGIEQQAEMVTHVFLARQGAPVSGAPSLTELAAIIPFNR